MRRNVITITPGATANDKPTVNHQDCHVSSQHGDVIEWGLSGPGTFSVEFPVDSPFKANQFDNANAVSGPPTVPQRTRPYKYTVNVPGNLPLDPDVIVDQ